MRKQRIYTSRGAGTVYYTLVPVKGDAESLQSKDWLTKEAALLRAADRLAQAGFHKLAKKAGPDGVGRVRAYLKCGRLYYALTVFDRAVRHGVPCTYHYNQNLEQ